MIFFKPLQIFSSIKFFHLLHYNELCYSTFTSNNTDIVNELFYQLNDASSPEDVEGRLILYYPCFFINSFLYFFRVYDCKEGYMILSRKTIPWQYFFTYLVPCLIGSFPRTLVLHNYGKFDSERNQLSPIIPLQLLKIFHFVRIPLSLNIFVQSFLDEKTLHSNACAHKVHSSTCLTGPYFCMRMELRSLS